MLAQVPNSRPSRSVPALPLTDVSLGPVVMADDPCEAAFGSADPTGPRKYYRARYYDPKIGRFISEDPSGFRDGPNKYTYVRNNPVKYVDPTGEAASLPGGGCDQDFLTCMANCIQTYDPLGPCGNLVLTGAGGTFPKVVAGQPPGLLGAGRMTTVPSVVQRVTGLGVRGVGRFFSPIWIIYGNYLFFMQVHCAAACAGYPCSY